MRLRAVVKADQTPAASSVEGRLERRINRIHLRQRLGLESDHCAGMLSQGWTSFHIGDWYLAPMLIRAVLRATGLYKRGRRNACAIRTCHNEVRLPRLPAAFDGFTLLHLSDLHLDMNSAFPQALIERLGRVEYDICVMTGDLRARTYGDFRPALAELGRVLSHVDPPVYAILGNHDSIRMVPPMEDMGITLLMNESVVIERHPARLYLAGVDDPHFYRLENFEKAAHGIPYEVTSILLAHSPEPYRRAAHAGFDLMLSGHTHGGQICLPGRFALYTNADCPRRFCAGAWRYRDMQGYTSVGAGSSMVDVRFNCPPEITLHRLRRGPV